MRKIITLSVLLSLSSFSLQASDEFDSVYSKCGIYDVLGTVKVDKSNVFLNFKEGDSKEISLKVVDAPYSLKMLESFPVKLKLAVQNVRGKNLEAKYVRTREEIQVFPGDVSKSQVVLEKEEECTPSRAVSAENPEIVR